MRGCYEGMSSGVEERGGLEYEMRVSQGVCQKDTHLALALVLARLPPPK